MTPRALSLHPVSATHPVRVTPHPGPGGEGSEEGEMLALALKWGWGAQPCTPTLERAELQREPRDSRQMHHSTTSTSPASLMKLQKVASLRVQTIKERACSGPLEPTGTGGPDIRQADRVAAGYFTSGSRHSGDPRKHHSSGLTCPGGQLVSIPQASPTGPPSRLFINAPEGQARADPGQPARGGADSPRGHL